MVTCASRGGKGQRRARGWQDEGERQTLKVRECEGTSRLSDGVTHTRAQGGLRQQECECVGDSAMKATV